MEYFEYKVVPAPVAGLKARGLKTTEARFANALETVMNDLGQDGWDYVRADTLPCEERSGLTGRVTKYQNMLVFRRRVAPAAEEKPEVAGLLEAPAPIATTPAEVTPPAPSAVAAPQGPQEPPLSRAGLTTTDEESASAAARAAAAALRSYRSDAGSDETPEARPRGTGVAAE